MVNPILPLALIAVLSLGCSSSKPQRAIPADSAAVREDFDPNALEDDFLLQPPAEGEVDPPPEATRRVAGFRVRVAMMSDRGRAEALRDQIQRDARVSTYIQRDPDTHLYKIQVGNCRAPEQAEKLRDAIRALGFRDAYVVRTRVVDVQP